MSKRTTKRAVTAAKRVCKGVDLRQYFTPRASGNILKGLGSVSAEGSIKDDVAKEDRDGERGESSGCVITGDCGSGSGEDGESSDCGGSGDGIDSGDDSVDYDGIKEQLCRK